MTKIKQITILSKFLKPIETKYKQEKKKLLLTPINIPNPQTIPNQLF